ncbi:MAG: copper homeostasis protein CutC [Flavobacteriales bacterium]
MKNLLEICIDSVESAIIAEKAGADRLELCENLIQGGVTPSSGKIHQIVQAVSIPVRVLIRPRAGDFKYSKNELDIIAADIEFCANTNCEGIVAGALTADSEIDEKLLSSWKSLAREKKLVFHRAFDLAKNPSMACQKLINAGFDTILTSGQQNSALEGARVLSALQRDYGSRINILAGGGIRASNISEIHKKMGITHFHSSAKVLVEGSMSVSMSSSPVAEQVFTVDSNEVELMKEKINAF